MHLGFCIHSNAVLKKEYTLNSNWKFFLQMTASQINLKGQYRHDESKQGMESVS